MPGMFDTWDERRERAASPTAGAPITPAAAGVATPYALSALAGEVANLETVPIGSGRNDQLNRSAVKLYGLAAAGEIDERTVTETLGAADGGLDFPATARTLRSARDAVYGRLGARHVEHTTPTTTREVPPWETSDDPLSEHYAAPSDGSGNAPVPSATESSAPPADPDAAYRQLVVVEARRVRLNRDARQLIDQEDAERAFRVPPYLPTLTDELALPDEPVTYAVDDVFPTGANVLLTAQYKTGKTTMVNNLARSFADGEPFLGRFAVPEPAGRVALFNYEVDARQYRRWLREIGIRNTDRVVVLNLRGYRLPLTVPHVETWVVDWLRAAEASVWIVDPFARAFTGGDENDNGEVGLWLDTLDVIKQRAGVGELVLPTHTGRAEQEAGSERARGATRLDDWADVRWLLTRDKAGLRYWRATGRDVEQDEAALAFDPDTRLLTLTGGDRESNEDERARAAVLTVVGRSPGIGVADLRTDVRGDLGAASNNRTDKAVAALIQSGALRRERAGHKVGHWLGGAVPDPLAA